MFGWFKWLRDKKPEIDINEVDSLCELASEANQRRVMKYHLEKSKKVKAGKSYGFSEN